MGLHDPQELFPQARAAQIDLLRGSLVDLDVPVASGLGDESPDLPEGGQVVRLPLDVDRVPVLKCGAGARVVRGAQLL